MQSTSQIYLSLTSLSDAFAALDEEAAPFFREWAMGPSSFDAFLQLLF